jgi:glutamate--cysteine ligase
VEYIEVRCIDLNPFLPLGIDHDQIDFMDIFLLTCLLSESSPTNKDEYKRVLDNQKIMVNEGRKPNLMLHDMNEMRSFKNWSKSLFQEMYILANILDQKNQTSRYNRVLKKFELLIENPQLTPSAKILKAMEENKKTFYRVAMDLSLNSHKYFQSREFESEKIEKYKEMATQSHKNQSMIEASDSFNFSNFLKKYYAQYD